MKDNLIDEERAKQEEAAQESLEQKIDRLGKVLELFFLLKFRYFEKATKIWPIFYLWFDITNAFSSSSICSCQI